MGIFDGFGHENNNKNNEVTYNDYDFHIIGNKLYINRSNVLHSIHIHQYIKKFKLTLGYKLDLDVN